MFSVAKDSLDDLMHEVFARLLDARRNFRVEASKGKNTEVFGALLELKNPRARLSRSQARSMAFSALGEFLWYVSGSRQVSFVEHYLPGYRAFSNDGVTANGAYGPRLFGENAGSRRAGTSEWNRVIRTLEHGPGSRNAVIQLFSNSDATQGNKDKPCTCTLQFAIRNDLLFLHTHMRSNDVIKGLPHDVFSFTMLQEMAAHQLGIGIGSYYHSVASLHLYDDTDVDKPRKKAKDFVREGLHDYVPMPEMPQGNPWPALDKLLEAEADIRMGQHVDYTELGLSPYWTDFAIMLRVHSAFRTFDALSAENPKRIGTLREISGMMNDLSSDVYRLYIRDRLSKKHKPINDLFSAAGMKV
ncbi:MAG: thymidylate synthase [Alphaproteobacteria bacterium]